jgi:hypothetical protein
MRIILRCLTLLLPLPCLLLCQQWEVGAGGGYGFLRDVPVTAGSITGSTGFSPGYAFGAVLGNQISRLVGGEVRYTYQADDLRVTSGSTVVKAKGRSQAVHYDILFHATSAESPIRPFLSAGAGVKLYQGTGVETPFQPLSNLVVLSHTTEAQPLVSVGGGVKFRVSRRALVRVDIRDYLSPLPTNLLATPRSSKMSGWMHDFVFLVDVSKVF